MNRRGFFGLVAGALAAPLVPRIAAAPLQLTPYTSDAIVICRASEPVVFPELNFIEIPRWPVDAIEQMWRWRDHVMVRTERGDIYSIRAVAGHFVIDPNRKTRMWFEYIDVENCVMVLEYRA